MKLNCISIKNPMSFLVASGVINSIIKPINTDYRGLLYIYSSGLTANYFIRESDIPKNLLKEYQNYVDVSEKGEKVEEMSKELDLLCQLQDFVESRPDSRKKPFLSARYIVGMVNLVDVVKIKNKYKWVFDEAIIFERKIPAYVNESDGIFSYEVRDEILERLNIKL